MKYKYISALAIALTLFSINNSWAKDLTGYVYGNDGDGKTSALASANVHWLGTTVGAVADNKGKFVIKESKQTKMLVASYAGYSKDTIEVSDFSQILKITLKSNAQTEEVNVTGKQSERAIQISQAPIKREMISTRGLQKAACCNLSESFQANPSIDVSFTNAVTGAKQIQMLGLQGVYIQMLNEQAPAMRGLSASLGLDYIPGPWMESIQISKGLASVSSGFESISGQINIEYKKPDKSEPLFLNAYFNDIGRFELNATTATKINDKWSTMLFAHGSFNQVKVDNNHDSFLDRPLSKQINFMNRWTYRDENFISQTYIKALYDEKNGGQVNYWPTQDKNYYGMQIKSEKYEILSKNGVIFQGDNYKSLALITSFTHYKINSFFDTTGYSGQQNSVYLKLMYQSTLFDSTHQFIVGASYSSDNTIEYVKPINRHESTGILEPKMESIPGAFAEYTYTGVENLTLMGGFRADFPNIYKRFLTPRFHAQYKFDENNSIRASAGKGYRIANIHAEDVGMFASARSMHMGPNDSTSEKLKPEEAWNYGINGTSIFNLFDRDFTLNAEYYRTEFQNQAIMDMERSTQAMYVYNLKGKSYSNSFQVDLTFEPIFGMTLTAAYRINDVKMTIDDKLIDKPLQSRTKGFLNIAYATSNDEWLLDFTAEYNGSGRIISTAANPIQYRMDETFPAFAMLHAQITKKFKHFDLYLGGENLTNYTQKNVIISADNPHSPYFEGALVWGPIVGRVIYIGTRLSFN